MTQSISTAESLLASLELVGARKACELLDLAAADPSATLRYYEAEDRILRVDWKGQAVYPRFQFDKAGREVYPALLEILSMRTDDWGGELALLHWLTCPNRSLGGARPCDRLAEDRDAILASFRAEISEPDHG